MSELNNFEKLLELAVKEDLGKDGDVTTRAIFSENDITNAVLIAKQDCVLSGVGYFEKVFLSFGESQGKQLDIKILKKDGDRIKKGETIATISGETITILEAERTGINFLSFLSGIATRTAVLVEIAQKKGNSVILDTRKTLPGFRILSKEAVKNGGGQNHRMGLYDMVLIKDNHIDSAGGIQNAIRKIKDKWGSRFKIEIECRNIEEVEIAVKEGVDIIMLDNMNREDSKVAIEKFKGKVLFECSGDMDEKKVEEYADIGVDYISVGGLTHSVKSISFSLQIRK